MKCSLLKGEDCLETQCGQWYKYRKMCVFVAIAAILDYGSNKNKTAEKSAPLQQEQPPPPEEEPAF